MEMDQQVKKKWVAALRSGEYKQTYGVLRDSDGYCCLGVLCDLFRKETGGGDWDEDNWFVIPGGESSETKLPGEVAAWAGVAGSFGELPRPVKFTSGGGGYTVRTLTSLNDDAQYSFSEIADVIEAQL